MREMLIEDRVLPRERPAVHAEREKRGRGRLKRHHERTSNMKKLGTRV